MARDHRIYLEDILEAIGKIRRYTGDVLVEKDVRVILAASKKRRKRQ